MNETILISHIDAKPYISGIVDHLKTKYNTHCSMFKFNDNTSNQERFNSVDERLSRMNQVDCMIIDVSYHKFQTFQQLIPSDVQYVFDFTSFIAQIIHKVLSKMQRNSHVIFIKSLIGKTLTNPICGTFASQTINGSIEGMFQSLYSDLQHDQIHVSTIALSSVKEYCEHDITQAYVCTENKEHMISIADVTGSIDYITSCRPNVTIKEIVLQSFQQPYNLFQNLYTQQLNQISIPSNTKPVAIVTGASQGMGKMTCLKLASMGFDLVLISRTKTLLDEVASLCEQTGSKTLVHVADIQHPSEVHEAFNQAISTFGKINVIFCNAAINRRKLLALGKLDILDSMMNANYQGHLHLIQLSIPYLISTPSFEPKAIIINGTNAVSSIYNSTVGTACYMASKYALLGLSNSLFEEIRQYGIKVTYMFTGMVNTELGTKNQLQEYIDQTELLQTNDIADCIEFILNVNFACPTHVNIASSMNPRLNHKRFFDVLTSQNAT